MCSYGGMFFATATTCNGVSSVGVYGPSKCTSSDIHIRFSVRYRKKTRTPLEYLPGPSIGGRSFEPAAMILLCIWLSVEDVLTGVDMMNEHSEVVKRSEVVKQSEVVKRREFDPVNTSLHTIDHEIGTRNEKERVVLERETRERDERKEKRYFLDILNNLLFQVEKKRIIAVTSLKIMKWYDYGYLDKIEVRREEQQLYKFKEGNFPRLRLQDIEDMLLLLVQQKLTNLTIDECYDLNVALYMFTRRIVIQWRVEDLQLGVERYQKKLNLTKPDIFRPDLRKRIAYTAYSDPQGVIYKDRNNINRLMHTNELYKFSDGTLTSVRTTLHDISSGIRMEYLPKRKWNRLDKRRARVMIQDIDKYSFPWSRQNRRDLPRDNPLVSVEVLMYDIKRSKSENKGIVPTEMKLVLEQTQQGISHEVSVFPMVAAARRERRRSVKVKELQKRCIIKASKLKNQEKYEHVGPKVTSTQGGKRSQDNDKGDCIWLMVSKCLRSQTSYDEGTSSSLKSKITTSRSQDEVMKTSLRAQD
ncbi:hypothetical protein Tco_0924288 [Tanacetum coccineum]|uniref:Uncharacterized protein n=1 Tax=Tanacetum coccineum TaxID=301880 RepID=A0ABQ5D9S3_9ASTR